MPDFRQFMAKEAESREGRGVGLWGVRLAVWVVGGLGNTLNPKPFAYLLSLPDPSGRVEGV